MALSVLYLSVHLAGDGYNVMIGVNTDIRKAMLQIARLCTRNALAFLHESGCSHLEPESRTAALDSKSFSNGYRNEIKRAPRDVRLRRLALESTSDREHLLSTRDPTEIKRSGFDVRSSVYAPASIVESRACALGSMSNREHMLSPQIRVKGNCSRNEFQAKDRMFSRLDVVLRTSARMIAATRLQPKEYSEGRHRQLRCPIGRHPKAAL